MTQTEKQRLGDMYREVIGYNIFEDDTSHTVASVIELMKGYDEETGTFEFFKLGAYSLDLFHYRFLLPAEVAAVLDRYDDIWDETYEQCEALLKELNALGYTFDYGLDAIPFELHKI